MKKYSKAELVKQDHLRRKRLQKTLVRRARRENPMLRALNKNLLSSVVSFQVPNRLDLSENHDETCMFFISIKEAFFKEGKRIFLDFSKLEDISPDAGLVLVSEIWRFQHYKPADKHRAVNVNGNYPANNYARLKLQYMGFYDLIKVKNPDSFPVVEEDAFEFIKYKTGSSVDNEKNKSFFDRLFKLDFFQGVDNTMRSGQYDSITESMTNVIHHAYPENIERKYPQMQNRWWMTGYVDFEDNEIMLSFFDQGVGIPKTLPGSYKKIMGIPISSKIMSQDSLCIREATKLGKSQTRKEERGEGLAEIVSFIEKLNNLPNTTAILSIWSNKGRYDIGHDGEKLENHKNSIYGTLIKIKVRKQNNDAEN